MLLHLLDILYQILIGDIYDRRIKMSKCVKFINAYVHRRLVYMIQYHYRNALLRYKINTNFMNFFSNLVWTKFKRMDISSRRRNNQRCGNVHWHFEFTNIDIFRLNH